MRGEGSLVEDVVLRVLDNEEDAEGEGRGPLGGTVGFVGNYEAVG